MSQNDDVIRSYDQVAGRYAEQFWNEFAHKPFDRMLLDWFAVQVKSGERVLEIGCGPGEVSGYLSRAGVDCTGTDGSGAMVENARKYFPHVSFEVQDFFDLKYDAAGWDAVIAFYAIVNMPFEQLHRVFAEVKRVLKPGGLFVFSFHMFTDEDKLCVEEFLDEKIKPLDFYFFDVDEMKALVEEQGFKVLDVLLRYPYVEVEYPSRRAYFVLNREGA